MSTARGIFTCGAGTLSIHSEASSVQPNKVPEGPRIHFSTPANSVQNGSGAHPASCRVGTGVTRQGLTTHLHIAWRFRMVEPYFHSLYGFMKCCLIARETLRLPCHILSETYLVHFPPRTDHPRCRFHALSWFLETNGEVRSGYRDFHSVTPCSTFVVTSFASHPILCNFWSWNVIKYTNNLCEWFNFLSSSWSIVPLSKTFSSRILEVFLILSFKSPLPPLWFNHRKNREIPRNVTHFQTIQPVGTDIPMT